MCNAYALNASTDEVASAFRARMPTNFNSGPIDIHPGQHGMVVREEAGDRIVEGMTWGFPLRLRTMKPTSKPKPLNNVAEFSAYPWKLFAHLPDRRCLIPLTGFREAEGPKGKMTRTWFSVKDRPIFAWAGLWGDSKEWGHWYSGVMTNCNEVVRQVHTRMPVLLHEEDYGQWLHGSVEDAQALKDRCFPDELTQMERTSELWFRAAAG